MSWEPIDDLPEETHPMEEPSVCDIDGHEFNFGLCDCGEVSEDYDPTPYGAELVTDPYYSPSYKVTGVAA